MDDATRVRKLRNLCKKAKEFGFELNPYLVWIALDLEEMKGGLKENGKD